MTNNPTQSRPVADLQGLRDALLAPHPAHRDPSGWLAHPAFPVFDEDVNTRFLLKAFGLETAFVLMSDECDIDDTAACEGNCSAWTPTPPEGEGWALTEIYDTEDGPCALFVCESKIARSRRRPDRADLDGQAEWRAAAAVYDHFDVDNALRALIADPTDYNATCAVRAVLRLAAAPAAPNAGVTNSALIEWAERNAIYGLSAGADVRRLRVAFEDATSLAQPAPAPAPAPAQQSHDVPDSVWEALQRLIENAASLGPASQDDALLVAQYRDRARFMAAPVQAGVGGAWKFNALYADTEVRSTADDKLLAVVHAGPERRHIVAALKSWPASADVAKSFCDTLDGTRWRRLMAFRDVSAERNRQDAQWGGADHDDTHNAIDWMNYISKQLQQLAHKAERRERLVKIAALSIAAIESTDRIEASSKGGAA